MCQYNNSMFDIKTYLYYIHQSQIDIIVHTIYIIRCVKYVHMT